MAVLKTDLDLTTKDLAGLTSADALAAFLSRLGYDTSRRTVLTPTSLGLSGDTATSIRSIELLSEDEDRFLRVLFVQPKSLTAKVRNDLIRIIGKSNDDYLLALVVKFRHHRICIHRQAKARRKSVLAADPRSSPCPRSSAWIGGSQARKM